MANYYKPDPSVADTLPAVLLNPANCAYLGGPIRAIDNYDFDPFEEIKEYNYPGRTVMVPAGEKMTALIYYSEVHMRYNSYGVFNFYSGFKKVSLPPLEAGYLYVLFIYTRPKFLKLDPNSGKFKAVKGAFYAR